MDVKKIGKNGRGSNFELYSMYCALEVSYAVLREMLYFSIYQIMSIRNQYLDQRISTGAMVHPALPFFHSCDSAYLQDILDAGELQPRQCKLYGEDLLYLFYGRPAYKSADAGHSRLLFMMPVVFIVNYHAVTTVKRAVAFDSGAFPMYEGCLHKSMKLKEFELTPTKDSLHKMIDYFYDGNDPYFNGEAKSGLKYDPVHFQVEGYHTILTGNHKTEVDDRKASLEVQLDYSIALNKNNIESIIIPKHLANSPTIKNMLDAAQIPMIPITNYGVGSTNYYVYILEQVKRHLIQKNLLNDN